MGIGMILFIRPGDMVRVARLFETAGERFYAIGNAHEGRREVTIDFRAS
jgi:phosphoribosylaminoimidazole (AIR) synthetase